MPKIATYRAANSLVGAPVIAAATARDTASATAALSAPTLSHNGSAPLDVQVDGQTAESWTRIIHQFSDATLYQSWAYGAVRWGERHLSHLVVRRGGKVIGAAQLRIARMPVLSVGVAYVRWGPLCHRHDEPFDPATARQIIGALRDEYVTKRRLALRIVPHLFSSDDAEPACLDAFARYTLKPLLSVPTYRTVLVDLTADAAELRRRLDKKWRNQLNAAEKNELEITSETNLDAYHAFAALYHAMRERKRFETTVDVAEFEQMLDQLPASDRLRIFVARAQGAPVAAVVCSHLGDTGIYLLGATSETGRALKAAYVLHWRVMQWLKQRGARQYDLGGVDRDGNAGGYHFKSGFGGIEVEQTMPHALHAEPLSRIVSTFFSWWQSHRVSRRR